MNCPYCLSEVSEEAFVCKVCTRDLYLFKPMMAKVADLEKRLEEIPNQEAYESRISQLEVLLDEYQQKSTAPKTMGDWLIEISLYLLVPLLLLLFAHWLIVVIYDTKMIYLRVISIVVPLPFAFALFKGHQHKLLPWFVGTVILSIASVIGMSWITSMVDHSPILPQTPFEWKELIEYAASIAFSFLTGMLLGRVAFASKQRSRRAALISPFMKAIANGLADGKLTPSNVFTIMKKLQEYGGMIVALGTTAISIYTGLKGIVGS